MSTEMTRIESMDNTERELVNLLSPEERKNALVEAGKVKHRSLDKKIMQRYLAKIAPGEIQPVTQVPEARTGTLYELTGKTVYVKDDPKPFISLGRVPGHESIHVLKDESGRVEFQNLLFVTETPGDWIGNWNRLGEED